MSDGDWKREVHEYIDEQIEAHNDANERRFKVLRDGQLKIEADMEQLETNLTDGLEGVRVASETAHVQILATLSDISARLERLERNQR